MERSVSHPDLIHLTIEPYRQRPYFGVSRHYFSTFRRDNEEHTYITTINPIISGDKLK